MSEDILTKSRNCGRKGQADNSSQLMQTTNHG